jgi:hypothetical protein
MADIQKDWRELCNAAIAAKDTDELLRIVNELNETLEREEKARRNLFNGSKLSEFHNNSEARSDD